MSSILLTCIVLLFISNFPMTLTCFPKNFFALG